MHVRGQAAHVIGDGREKIGVDLAAEGLEFQPLDLAGEGLRRNIDIRHEAHERCDLLAEEGDGIAGDATPEIDIPRDADILPDLADGKRVLTDAADHGADVLDRPGVG